MQSLYLKGTSESTVGLVGRVMSSWLCLVTKGICRYHTLSYGRAAKQTITTNTAHLYLLIFYSAFYLPLL
jgi:hypothetical protein